MMNHKLYANENRKSLGTVPKPSIPKLSLDGSMVNEALPCTLAKIEKIVFELYRQCNYKAEITDVSATMCKKVNHLRDEIEILRMLIASSSALRKENSV